MKIYEFLYVVLKLSNKYGIILGGKMDREKKGWGIKEEKEWGV